MPEEQRYLRQVALFGADGQRRIEGSNVAIVGLGGLGSHVVQQLAYLGVRTFSLIDDDVVSESNLNRLIGATPDDIGTQKIDIASRLAQEILPGTTISSHPSKHDDEACLSDLGASTVVFGCVDDEPSRLNLLERCAELGVPYLDAATDVILPGDAGGELVYGGRVCFNFVTSGCLSCLDQLDQEELRVASMTADQRRAHDEIYGISRDLLDGGGPAVVSLNGVVASLAVTEFLVWITGLREPRRVLTYAAEIGGIRVNLDNPPDSCPYCVSWRRNQTTG